MSWDLFVQDVPAGIRSINEIPDDFVPSVLGDRAHIVERIRSVAPESDFSDPAWGQIEGDGFSIEINLGEEEEVESFALHVRGDERALFMVQILMGALGFQALDPASESGLLQVDRASDGFVRWQAYRNRAVGGGGA